MTDLASYLRVASRTCRVPSQVLFVGGGLTANEAVGKADEALSGHGFLGMLGLMMRDGVWPIGRSLRLANQRRAVCQLWLLWAHGLVVSLQNIPPTGHLQGHCLS